MSFYHLAPRYSLRGLLLVVFGIGLYVLGGLLGMEIIRESQVTLIWPPSGFVLAIFFLLGLRYWPIALIGAFLLNLHFKMTVGVALLIAFGNTVEPLLGALLMKRLGFDRRFLRQKDAAILAAAAFGPTIVSAITGGIGLYLADYMNGQPFYVVALEWWMGDAAGVLLIAPVILTATKANLTQREGGVRAPAFLLLLSITGLISTLVFFMEDPNLMLALSFLVIPCVFIAAIRFGALGAAITTFLVAFAACYGTVLGRGPFVSVDGNGPAMLLWGFVTVNTVISLYIASLLSERRQVLEKARAREGVYRKVLEGVDGLVATLDVEGRLLTSNAALQKMLGLAHMGRINQNLIDALQPEQHRDLAARFDDFLKSGRGTFTFEAAHPDCDGKPRLTSWTVLRSPDPSDRTIKAFGRDFSERRLAEEIFRELMQSAPEAILVFDERRKVSDLNPAAEALFSGKRRDLTGVAFTRLFPEDEVRPDRRRLNQFLARPDAEPPKEILEIMASEITGERFPVELCLGVFGGVQGRRISCFIRDLRGRYQQEDERRSLEHKIRDDQKIESLGILAGGIAHDFNNLLVGVLGNAGLVLDDLDGEHPVRPYVQRIHRAALRAGELARQMLAYAGKATYVVEPLDLNNLIDQYRIKIKGLVTPGVEIFFDLEAARPFMKGDRTQLQQVLDNLVTNARDALPSSKGNITIRTYLESFTRPDLDQVMMGKHLEEGRHLVLEVRDSGSGMDARTRQRIFDPFFTTKITGRGLGLSAVQGIVRGHKGALALDSETGAGTSIRLIFPTCAEPVPKPKQKPAEASWRGHGKVLVIDDEEFVLHFAGETLKRLGFEALAADSGKEGLRILEKHPDIRLVLLDLIMPDMDGEDVLKAMRASGNHTPVALISGHNEREVANHLDQTELAGYLQKPFAFHGLKELLKTILKD